MRQNATVVEVEGDRALVSVTRSSACDGCHRAAEGCSACSLLGGDRKHIAPAQNPIGAKVGERVTVEAPDSLILGYAAFVFLFPVAVAILLFLSTAHLFEEGTPYAVLFGIGGFAVAVLIVFCVSALLSRRKPSSVIVERLSCNDGNESENSEFES